MALFSAPTLDGVRAFAYEVETGRLRRSAETTRVPWGA